MNSAQLRFSVITVCYNAVSVIEETIKSVLSQSYDNIEYIVIDGGSTDGTLDIIQAYSESISLWISEADNGIYDAMNKGIGYASGNYICFMNAGDSFTNEDALDSVAKQIEPDATLIACGWNDITHNSIIERKPLPLKYLKRSMLCSHQALLIDINYHKSHLYDISLKICADYNLVYNAVFNDGVKIQLLDTCVANYVQDEGLSARNMYRLEREKLKIWNGNKLINRVIVELTNLRRLLWKQFSRLIPSSLSKQIMRHRLSRK